MPIRVLQRYSTRTVLDDLNRIAKPVTITSIERVKALPSSILDESGQKKLQQAHKDVLQEVMNRGGMVEVARCYDMNMQPLCDYVSKNDKGQVKIPRFDVPYIAIHNHPSGLTFSPADIYNIVDNHNMEILTDVGNNGAVYTLEKSEMVDVDSIKEMAVKAENDIKSGKSELMAINIAVRLLKEVGEYGIRYNH